MARSKTAEKKKKSPRDDHEFSNMVKALDPEGRRFLVRLGGLIRREVGLAATSADKTEGAAPDSVLVVPEKPKAALTGSPGESVQRVLDHVSRAVLVMEKTRAHLEALESQHGVSELSEESGFWSDALEAEEEILSDAAFNDLATWFAPALAQQEA